MSLNIDDYRPLPGRARRRMGMLDGTRGRLLLGRDHVLHLHDGQFQEISRRFYLRDIQAISIRPSTERGWAIGGLFLLVLLLLTPAMMAGPMDAPEVQSVLLGVGLFCSAIPGAIIVLNLLLGPRCHCCLHTAAHTEELYGQSRLRTALEVRAVLEQAIRMAQPAMPQPAVAVAPATEEVAPASPETAE